ncbi:type VII secretion system-associated protein [Streptomyces sp. NPDC006990]|uniref:type VII secretion system-associated protein n=1 Tax=Streptomyces sp. NPDC006990 TaxID=3154481 RepID=UPI00345695E7
MADGDDGSKLVLNKEWMKKFIDDEIDEFKTALDKISKEGDYKGNHYNDETNAYDVEHVMSVTELSDPTKQVDSDNHAPLALGDLVGKEGAASEFADKVRGVADELGVVITDQKRLFDDIEDALREAMESLLKTEGDSLEKIDGDKFITSVFEDVSDDISDSLGGGSGGYGEDD